MHRWGWRDHERTTGFGETGHGLRTAGMGAVLPAPGVVERPVMGMPDGPACGRDGSGTAEAPAGRSVSFSTLRTPKRPDRYRPDRAIALGPSGLASTSAAGGVERTCGRYVPYSRFPPRAAVTQRAGRLQPSSTQSGLRRRAKPTNAHRLDHMFA